MKAKINLSTGEIKFVNATEVQQIIIPKILNHENKYVITGIYDKKKNKINLINISRYNEVASKEPKPIYSLPMQVDQLTYRRLVTRAFNYYEENNYEIKNVVPAYFNKKYRLLDRKAALKILHYPKTFDEIYQGLRVLKYEECLKFTLKTELIREENKRLETERLAKENLAKSKRKNARTTNTIYMIFPFLYCSSYSLINFSVDSNSCFVFLLTDSAFERTWKIRSTRKRR